MAVPHPRGGAFFGLAGKDNIIRGKEGYKSIGIRVFYYKFFEEYEGGGVRNVIDGCPYLNHIIGLWPIYWEE